VDLITLDFETYYDKEYSLRKITTEAYVRDPRFEVIGVGVKVNNKETEWASGTHEQTKNYLKALPWENSMVLCHNTMFDGAILSWRFDIRPRMYTDTLCIARALHGTEAGGSLAALSQRYNIGTKGTEVLDALGKRRGDFGPEELERYGDYCINDVNLTYKLFATMAKGFPKRELHLIDLTLRMFTEPTLDLDTGLLESHLEDIKERKDQLMRDAGITDKKELMSNLKFADILTDLGVEPPMKISPTTGKDTFAFAKNDEAFKQLLDHENDQVQALVSARLGTKSSLSSCWITRTIRFRHWYQRGSAPNLRSKKHGRSGSSTYLNVGYYPYQ